MTTLTWTVGASGLWTTASNWSPAQVPGSGDVALVTLPGAYLISLPGSASVDSLTLDDATGAISIGGSLDVTSALDIVAGSLSVGGTLNTGTLVNAGSVSVGGTLGAGGFSNAGTITDTGSITLSGSMTAASVSRIGGSGLLTVSGTVDNAGGTLDGTSLSQLSLVGLGTLLGGTVTGLTLLDRSTLVGVTWHGTLAPASLLTIENGLTLTGTAGTGPGALQLSPYTLLPGTLEFAGSQTFDNASVPGFGTVIADDTLTIGSGVTFSETPISYITPASINFAGAGAIINSGTILGQAHEYTVADLTNNGLISIGPADFENFGVIDAIDTSAPGTVTGGIGSYFPGLMTTSITAASFVNHAGGIIEIGQSAGVSRLTIAATAGFTNDGTLLTQDTSPTSIAGGTIDIAALVNGSGTIELSGSGVVDLHSAVSATEIIDFTGAGSLILDQPAFVPATINGFGTSDRIQLGIAATGVSYTDGDLKMQAVGGGTFDLAVTGQSSLADFVITTGTASTTIQLACFATGTRLATTHGAVPVEALREGDMMLADGNDALPIVWIGRRTLDCHRHPAPHKVWPVRIAAGSFGDGTPCSDLYLSPDHAVFVNGVLIPVKYLVNGRTIAQEPVDSITYWHIELPRHAVLLAEGLPAESLMPGSDRSGFENGGRVVTLHPDFTSLQWESHGCAPLQVTGPAVHAARRMLEDRAERHSHSGVRQRRSGSR